MSIQNTNVANTLVMIATAPMISAILGSIFLKEPPDKKTWISIIITFFAIIYIFFDSLKIGNFYGDILGFITALGLAVGAVTIRSAKSKNLVPAAVVGKLIVATFALFFIESFALINKDLYIIPLMCIMCVAIPFVLVTIAPRFIPAAEVNLFFTGNYNWTYLGLDDYKRTTKHRNSIWWSNHSYYNRHSFIFKA